MFKTMLQDNWLKVSRHFSRFGLLCQSLYRKTNAWSRSGIVALLAVLLTVGIVFARDQQVVTANMPGFREYVSAYSAGVISKKSTIRIRLLTKVAKQIDHNMPLPAGLIELSPNVEGTIKWADEQTLEFVPEKDLTPAERYFVSCHLNQLLPNMPKALHNFNFEVQVLKQNFEVRVEEIRTTNKQTLEEQEIRGTILTADVEDLERLAEVLEVSQDNKTLEVEWSSLGERHYQFVVKGIKRTEQVGKLLIRWDGKAIGVDKHGQKVIVIPGIDTFSFLSHSVENEQDNQYLRLQFSDPLKLNQDLEGLITIAEQQNLRFAVDGNILKVYPQQRLTGNYMVYITQAIKNCRNTRLNRPEDIEVTFEDIKPAVRFKNDGVILPESQHGLVMPFEAVNLKAVDIQVVKIFENNITQFLQVNDLSGDNELRRVGQPVLRKVLRLDQFDVTDFNNWNDFTLDLNKLIKTDPGAIYRVTLAFRKSYSTYDCGDSDEDSEMQALDEQWEGDPETDPSYWDVFEGTGYDYYYYDDYWENRDNPCSKHYYRLQRAASQNIIASNIGVIAKKGRDETTHVFVTDLRTAKPIEDAKIEVLNYQQQVLKSAESDREGICVFSKLKDPYFVVVKQGKERGYLKIKDGSSLSLSRFDVSGDAVVNGMKGYIYGERGVWRPGDSLYVSFILQEEAEPLPQGYPIIFELRNPQNQLVRRLVHEKNESNFYTFRLKTDADAPTGNWETKISVGGVDFSKSLKIETVKPNRLKIQLDVPGEYITAQQTFRADLKAKWLHGATASNLKAEAEVFLSAANTKFKSYDDYDFDDPTKSFYSESQTVLEAELNADGVTEIVHDIVTEQEAPGMLNATFLTKVYEPSGEFSIDRFAMPYHPYEAYVGIKAPKGDKRGMLLTDKDHKIDLITLRPDGKLDTRSHTIELEFYKLNWRWWWDQSQDDLSNFRYRSSVKKLKDEVITTQNGKGQWTVNVKYPDWGRYMVRAYDKTTGHSSAKVIYIDWPGWAGRARKDFGDGAAMLTFTSNKERYNIGEEVELTIPSSDGGRALVSIESGTKVLETYWVDTKDEQTKFKFKATSQMTPNVYIHVSLLQPHAQTENDRPIRLYGIHPISVEDPDTHIEPVLTMPDELEAEEIVNITVEEKSNRPMTYTLAIVDEGLLDLTRFKTPDPWNSFYAKEALGVKTWDIYDWVIGAYSGKLQRLLSVGGDDGLNRKQGSKAQRFKPMVKFIGPFHLEKGKKTHRIQMPKYVGSVRTMVIAREGKAYGKTEKTTPVTKPLMVLATLPRVLSPGETVKLPVSVFAMKNHIKNVQVSLKTNENFVVTGQNNQAVEFAKTGEKTITFDVKADKIGIAKVELIATSGGERATYEIELDVRMPNPEVSELQSKVLAAGETWNLNYTPVGIAGTNSATIEVSAIPPINLSKRLNYLLRYPHGCIEQTTSGAFPQLFVEDVMQLDDKRKALVDENVKGAINRLMSFQLSNGGMGYWPNSSDANHWGTTYAGHFLLEAKKKGYNVPDGFMKKWVKFQKRRANDWNDDGKQSQLIQSYRLYTLALAGEAERGAMNRMHEIRTLDAVAKWRLAAAYKLIGRERVAESLVNGLTTSVPFYRALSNTYGSDTRDKAMILETMNLMGMAEKAFTLLQEISNTLNEKNWLSTQTTAYALLAASKYVKTFIKDDKMSFTYQHNNGKKEQVATNQVVAQSGLTITGAENGKLQLTNTSGKTLYAKLLMSGVPEPGKEEDAMNDLQIQVRYFDLSGNVITPSSLKQGTNFLAEVKVRHPGSRQDYKEMALTQLFPSGWEIINTRMLEIPALGDGDQPTYQDIRDDRVYTYFDIDRGKTKKFYVLLNASYAGRYYMPAVYCEAMYDATINAQRKGEWVTVY